MAADRVGHCGQVDCKMVQLKGAVAYDCLCKCRICSEAMVKMVDAFMKAPPLCMCDTGLKCQIHPQEGSLN